VNTGRDPVVDGEGAGDVFGVGAVALGGEVLGAAVLVLDPGVGVAGAMVAPGVGLGWGVAPGVAGVVGAGAIEMQP